MYTPVWGTVVNLPRTLTVSIMFAEGEEEKSIHLDTFARALDLKDLEPA